MRGVRRLARLDLCRRRSRCWSTGSTARRSGSGTAAARTTWSTGTTTAATSCPSTTQYTTAAPSNGKRPTHHHAPLLGAGAVDGRRHAPADASTPESFLDRFVGRLTNSDIELESEDFNRAFTVTCPDRKFASDVLHPRMMEFLLQHRDLGWRFEQRLDAGDRRSGRRDIAADRCHARASSTRSSTRCPEFVWRELRGAGDDARCVMRSLRRGRSSTPAAQLVVMYNRFVRQRTLVDESWGGIDVELTRRHELIPNLVETVQGYAAHERAVLEALVRAREAGDRAPGDDPASARGLRGRGQPRRCSDVLARAEAYPDLKASANFLQLQDELTNTEDRIAAARRFYNGNVRAYNTRVRDLPVQPGGRRVRLPSPGLLRAHRPGRRAHRLTDSSAVWPGALRCGLADESALASSHTGIGPLPRGGPMTRSRTRVRTGAVVGTAVAVAAAMVVLLDSQAARADARSVTLVSTGSAATNATFSGAPSGTTGVFFMTAESLSASDGDAATDVYRNDGGTVSLVTPGTTAVVTFQAASADGSAVVIGTTQPLTGGDIDIASDLYRVVGGVYTLLSGGSAGTAAVFRAASPTADTVVFETAGGARRRRRRRRPCTRPRGRRAPTLLTGRRGRRATPTPTPRRTSPRSSSTRPRSWSATPTPSTTSTRARAARSR